MTDTHKSQQCIDQPLLVQALKNTASAIFITDSSGKIVWVNDAFHQLSGYSEQETIGQTPAILQSGSQTRTFYAKLWRTIRSGKVWQGEIIDRRKDGSLYTVDEIITPLFDDQGAITHFIAIQHDITRSKREHEREHHLAYHDLLTKLPNRVHFLDMLAHAIEHAQKSRQMLALMFLDLDEFKPVNDSLGHQAGDQLLEAVAERMRAAVRLADTVARFGGDEFAILLTHFPNVDVAPTLAQKLVDILSKPFMVEGEKISISVSIGIALYPDHGQDAETLLNNADKAMYQAKCRGGKGYRMFDATLDVSH